MCLVVYVVITTNKQQIQALLQQSPVDQFEATVSQSTVPSPLLGLSCIYMMYNTI